ncbi:carbon-nitrogen hydrolase family protein [Halomonas huangheensis]|uniref:CN hydrolase domain-containing protein n=1 Tax=Halomonas huangheensis TaxID=1178482 RepID=W1NB94_9GAMM|nr:carbon-nitrogen hydrolase family protein [Halomonas huangheensis]ALM53630.1 hypothetical protein AR456_16125 [Halomonas huangheensis]ERL52471.1 hypothetical protein BJB45_10925 [Halomonas huangheensis]
MRIAAAQFRPIKGNIDENLSRHLSLIKVATQENIDLIVFPELSLTGYEPELAAELAISAGDPRLARLQKIADENQLTIVCGAPIANESPHPQVGSLIIAPGQRVLLYRKIHLHPGENTYFTAGHQHCTFAHGAVRAGVAICADTQHEHHAAQQKTAGADLYLVSSAITAEGYKRDTGLLERWARRYEMPVVMANFHGATGEMLTVGSSSIWDRHGKLLVQACKDRDTLAMADISTSNSRGWTRILPHTSD